MIGRVLEAFGRRPSGAIERVAAGTLNHNYRVGTETDDLFVRLHRSDAGADEIRAEHALIRWVAERGVPVARPIVNVRGETLVAMSDGGLWSVHPWIDGRVIARGTATAAEAMVLGDMHGRTQALLARHPASAGATFDKTWDRAASLSRLQRVLDAAARAGAERWIRDGIALQARLLDREPLRLPSEFAALPCQVVHGDYHDEQVLLDDDGGVAAVVDWEQCGSAARVYELVRAIAFSGLVESPHLEPYLDGYRRHVRLSEAECRLGMQLWWQSRLGGTWLWDAYFLEGNERVAPLFAAAIAACERLADASWRDTVTERMVAAALG